MSCFRFLRALRLPRLDLACVDVRNLLRHFALLRFLHLGLGFSGSAPLSMGRPGQAVQDSSSSSRTTLSSWARLAAALGGLRGCGGGPAKSRCCQVRQAPPKQQQPGPKSGSLIHVVRMLTAESEVQVWPSCLVPGSCGVPGPRQHRNTANRRRRAQDPTTTTTTTRRRAQPRPRSAMPAAGWLSTTTGQDRGEDQRRQRRRRAADDGDDQTMITGDR